MIGKYNYQISPKSEVFIVELALLSTKLLLINLEDSPKSLRLFKFMYYFKFLTYISLSFDEIEANFSRVASLLI